ncbi:uncharacterized protein LOC116247105 isoform X2 [Nymphaea colorata]|nr:uncharacterized protein LOC116247105 isoform X2 [Nymphaea colorata]XP_049931746.1 uncharacterized protein LOC116247105 isoform X2 [Nymphaea colorata]
MGCTTSRYATGKKKPVPIREIVVFVPSTRVPKEIDLRRPLRGSLSEGLLERLAALRAKVVALSEKWSLNCSTPTGNIATEDDVSSITGLQDALEEYLPVLTGLTKKDYHLQDVVEFDWGNPEEGGMGLPIANSWYELLSVLHIMAMVSLSAANRMLIPKDQGDAYGRKVSEDCMKTAIELLLKAAGYLEYGVHHALVNLTPDAKRMLPKDLEETMLEAISHQALGQAIEIQLSLAVESEKATLSVMRRLACEQLTYFAQAYLCLSSYGDCEQRLKKHLLFVKWKYLEAKAAAYYYHGLLLDKGTADIDHVNALSCLLAADELLADCKRICLTFCLAKPVTRVPPAWGAMKHLQLKIPETLFKKSQMYGYLLDFDGSSRELPDLPEFELSLKPDEYELPTTDPVWENEKCELRVHTLKQHLKDSEDEMEMEFPREDV